MKIKFENDTDCMCVYTALLTIAKFGTKDISYDGITVKDLLKMLNDLKIKPEWLTCDLNYLIHYDLYGWNKNNILNPSFSGAHNFYINDPIQVNTIYKRTEVYSRSDILEKANKIVNGKREDEYGTPEDNFKKIGDVWSWYINSKYKDKDIHLTDEDIANLMVLFKVARNTGNKSTLDNYIDICGYGAIGGELSNK